MNSVVSSPISEVMTLAASAYRKDRNINPKQWPWQECLSSFGSGNDLIWYPLLCTYFHVNECKMRTLYTDLLWWGTGSHTVTTCDLPCEVSLIIHPVL